MDIQRIRYVTYPTSYDFSMEEFKKAWAMISADPAITLKEIAFHLGFSKSKAFAMTKLIAQCGFVKRKSARGVFTVFIPYVEIPKQMECVSEPSPQPSPFREREVDWTVECGRTLMCVV